MKSPQEIETARRIAERLDGMIKGDIATIVGRLKIIGFQPAHMVIYLEGLAAEALRAAIKAGAGQPR